VKNLLVRVTDSFILADFVVLDMEGDLGISLILGRPFLRDTKVKIDVGARKIHLRIMGKKVMFMFQTKCDIQVVRQLDTKFGYIICKQDIVYTSCTKQ
jgi:hypothetical protein